MYMLLGRGWACKGFKLWTLQTTSAGRIAMSFNSGLTASASNTEYPTSPKVGIGVVLLRKHAENNEVLLVRRGKEPEKGKLTFPGGSLELGETIAECAARELMEETGLKLLNRPPAADITPRTLSFPRPVDAIDIIRHDGQGRLQYHYTIVDVAALPEDPNAQPKAADDAEEVIWLPVSKLKSFEDISKDHQRIAEAACERFDIPDEVPDAYII